MAENWVEVATVAGKIEAEIVRGLLASFEIPSVYSQESAGAAIGLTIGWLGEVHILVPQEKEEAALHALDAYYKGELEQPGEEEPPASDEP